MATCERNRSATLLPESSPKYKPKYVVAVDT
jgi:hypothetical protein